MVAAIRVAAIAVVLATATPAFAQTERYDVTFRDHRRRDRPEWNIAAGIAYSRQLWDAWTDDAVVEHLREFMLASYNAGRLTLLRAQQVAEWRSLDPTAVAEHRAGGAHRPALAVR